jgi:uncharacterized protein
MNHRPGALKEAFIYLALTLGLSFFVFWGPLALFQVPAISFVRGVVGPGWAIALFLTGGFVPSLAALALTWFWEGRAGLGRMGRRIIQLKIGWRWYLAAVALIVFGTLGQLLILRLLGQSFDLAIFLVQLPSALPLIVLGPLSEELGWRGYALDRLQTRWNPLVCAVIVGAAWGLWHLPLFLMPGTSQHELSIPYAGFFCAMVGNSILLAWLHNHTGGSLWTAIFFHWIYTYSGQVMASGVTRSVVYNGLEYTPYLLAALVIALIWRGKPALRLIQT